MPCDRVVVLMSLTALCAVAGCSADPGTVSLQPYYHVTSSSSGGGEGGAGTTVTTTTTTTTTTTAGTGGAGGLGGAGGQGGEGGTPCTCADGLSCCGEACVNLNNDVLNCGECGNACTAPNTCIQGECKDPCPPDFGCDSAEGKVCCGLQCCDPGLICCDYGAAGTPELHCQPPENGTCPVACSGCN
jgi:hypothetical protein